MHSLLQDLKYGVRIHAKTLGLTSIAILTLAMGIGACTAAFSVVDAILLRPLPYSKPAEIVIPWRLAKQGSGAELGYDKMPWGPNAFRFFRQELKSFQSLGAFQSQQFTLTGLDEPKLLEGLQVSAGFFSVLGVNAMLGRTFTAEEDQPGHKHEVVLSYELWQEQFGASQHLLGLSLDLNDEPYTIIGVMPPGFSFPHANEMPESIECPREAQLWVPLALSPANVPDDNPWALAVIARLKSGVSVRDAQSEMDVLASRLDGQLQKFTGSFNSRILPLRTQVVGDTGLPLFLMLGAVGAVLLIACANVASLLLTRSLVRRREFTIRAALGAVQGRLVRQVLTESLVLAAAAGLLGIVVGQAGIYLVKLFGPENVPRLKETSLDLPVFAFALAVTAITGILFGLAPAIGAIRQNLAESLKEGNQRSGGSPIGPRIRRVLIVSQVALALILVIASGLVAKTFFRLLHVETGFKAPHVLTFQVSLLSTKYPNDDSVVRLYDRLLLRIRSVAGVQSAGMTVYIPMTGSPDTTPVRIMEHRTARGEVMPFVSYSVASPGYFSALGTSLLKGRDFQDSDTGTSPPVTIINNTMAGKFWPGENAIGKQLGLLDPKYPVMTVIGIVADVKHTSLREIPGPEMYVPYTQKPWRPMSQMQFAVRAIGEPTAATESVRAAIHSVDPDLPMANVATLTALTSNAMAQPRFAMLLMASFGMLALVLASVGMYGVISYSVTQRTQEIGIRMAMGAQRRDIFRMVLGQGVFLAALGVLIGLASALALTQLMRSFLYQLLYGVSPIDPLVYGAAVSALLLSVAVLACYVPARRATRVDPVIALRDE